MKMWTRRRLKALGLDNFTVLDYSFKEVRVHLELAVPVWHSGLTLTLAADIERVQRVAVSILLENSQFEYMHACTMLGLKPLYIWREELCKRFAIKTAKPVFRHRDLFRLETTIPGVATDTENM